MPDTASVPSHRTSLHFDDLQQVIAHVRTLEEAGYVRLGNWNLGQVCNHLAQTIDFSVDGFPVTLPAPFSPVMRWAFFNTSWGQALVGRLRIPALPVLRQKQPVDDAEGRDRLFRAAERIADPDTVFQRSLPMGHLSFEQWHRFHVWHAERHLSFLQPASEECKSDGGHATGATVGMTW